MARQVVDKARGARPGGQAPPKLPPVDPPRRGGDDDGMEERLRNLERDVAVIKSNYATKEDLQALGRTFEKSLSEQTWKIIGWGTGVMATVSTALVAAAFYIARNVH